jgi:hypothetical protein
LRLDSFAEAALPLNIPTSIPSGTWSVFGHNPSCFSIIPNQNLPTKSNFYPFETIAFYGII